jgi:hypothetical protein
MKKVFFSLFAGKYLAALNNLPNWSSLVLARSQHPALWGLRATLFLEV